MWSTANEIEYINQLVSGKCWENCDYVPKLEPDERVKNYIKSATKRKRANTFGRVNADEVIAFAKSLLRGK